MKNKKTLPLIYVLGMPIIFILANSIARLNLEIFGAHIYISVFLYPLLFLISGLIIKHTDYKDALKMMVVTLSTQTLVYVLIWALLDRMDSVLMIYSFLSFGFYELIFIYTYDFLVKIKKNTYMSVFILILALSILDNALFGPLIEGQEYSLSILIRLAYTVILPVFLSIKETKKINKK